MRLLTRADTLSGAKDAGQLARSRNAVTKKGLTRKPQNETSQSLVNRITKWIQIIMDIEESKRKNSSNTENMGQTSTH